MAAVKTSGAWGPKSLIRELTVPALVGPGRAAEVAVNVVLPYAAAQGDRSLSRLGSDLYRRLTPLYAQWVRHLETRPAETMPIGLPKRLWSARNGTNRHVGYWPMRGGKRLQTHEPGYHSRYR